MAWYIVALPAIDHLDLITSMSGEFEGVEFGAEMIAMDFNGDSYDDLIVSSPCWNPNGAYSISQQWGKLYFYWGGPGFDNVADYIVQGSTNGELLQSRIMNAGDINGDGIDDLALTKNPTQISVYFGSPNPTGIPDLTIGVQYQVGEFIAPTALGDINGDGHADLAIIITPFSYTRRMIKIWTGNSQQMYQLAETTNLSVPISCNGVGDVNADGYADYILQHGVSGGNNTNTRIVLYYGNPNFPQADSLVITDNTNQGMGSFSGYPLGDINHDGFDDFTVYNGRIWYGGENITAINDTILEYWGTSVYNNGVEFVYGDINNDGDDDIISSNAEVGYYNGEVGIWLGSPNMNGVCDLYLHPPVECECRNFGWAKAAGDFNADGVCDLAISAPWWGTGTTFLDYGKVFVYSGNAQWVGISDPVAPEQIPNPWQVELYPNPLRQGTALKIGFTGSGYKHQSQVDIEIYNLKGQKLSGLQAVSPDAELALSENLTSKLISGIYMISISDKGTTLYSKKICVIK